MTTYAAFLRGINVGAHNRMKMADLRDACESIGLEDVRTYIQSGNVVFEATDTDPRAVEEDIVAMIEDEFGYDITAMVRTRAELDEVVNGQPFDVPAPENTKLYVTFLDQSPADKPAGTLDDTEAEQFVVDGRDVYSQVDTDELTNGRFTDVGDVLKTSATRRTWNVVTRVNEMASE